MDNKLIGMSIAAMLVIVLTGSLLVPIINDAVDDTKEYYNNGAGHYASIVDDTVTLNIALGEGDDPLLSYTVDGVSQSTNKGKTAILISDNCTIYGPYTNTLELTGVDKDGNLISPVRYSALTVVVDADSITVTGTLVSDSSTVNYEFDNGWAFYRFSSGDYRVLDNVGTGTVIYVNNVDQVYSSNWITTTSEFFNLNGTDVTIRDGSTETTATASITLTDVMNGVKSFLISNDRTATSAFHFVVDNNGEDYDVYPFYFVIPASVYGQTESNVAMTGLLYALPIMIIVSLVASFAILATRKY